MLFNIKPTPVEPRRLNHALLLARSTWVPMFLVQLTRAVSAYLTYDTLLTCPENIAVGLDTCYLCIWQPIIAAWQETESSTLIIGLF